MYKTKLKENGEVGKYKKSLVVKCYKQDYYVNYKKVFLIMIAKHDIIKLIIVLVAKNLYPILDAKSIFLHEDPG